MQAYPHHIISQQKKSAEVLVHHIHKLLTPSSVLDVGCGPGLFLKKFKELGVKTVQGVDHKIDPELLDQYLNSAEYLDHNLNLALELEIKYDLCLCLEVAEHLNQNASDQLIKSLCSHADTIVFSAAIPYQGGINHINEQWPEYWIQKFKGQGYTCYDIIRPAIWHNEKIEWWYRQNILLFSKVVIPGLNDLFSYQGDKLVHPGQLIKYKQQIEAIYAGKKSTTTYLKWLAKSLINRR